VAKLKGGTHIAGNLTVEGILTAVQADLNGGSLNNVILTPPVTTSTITLADGITFTVNASITLQPLTANHALYASATNTIAGEAYLALTRGGTGAGDIVTARDNLDTYSRAETSDEAAALAIALG
jgi:hypothetical protein